MNSSESDRRGPGGAGDDARREAETLARKARQETEAAGESVRREAEGLASKARQEAADIGETAKERIRELADDQRRAGASAVHNVATAARSAAEDLEKTSPELARYTREAASAVDSFSDAIERRSFGDVLRDVDDFARREPVAFFGASLVTGFAISRFLGSSARPSKRREMHRAYERDDDYRLAHEENYTRGRPGSPGSPSTEFGRHQDRSAGSGAGLGVSSTPGGLGAGGGSGTTQVPGKLDSGKPVSTSPGASPSPASPGSTTPKASNQPSTGVSGSGSTPGRPAPPPIPSSPDTKR